MKDAIILHGGPSKKEYYDLTMPSASNSHWIPWLQGQLLKADISTSTPEVPHSFDRNWEVWQKEVERYDITPETILVGHSTGAGFWIKYLSIHPEIKVGKVVLVAPWLDPYQEHTKNFFDDFAIDSDLANRTSGVIVLHSDNDEKSVMHTVEIVRKKVNGVIFKEFPGYGHFCTSDLKSTEFPELLQIVLE